LPIWAVRCGRFCSAFVSSDLTIPRIFGTVENLLMLLVIWTAVERLMEKCAPVQMCESGTADPTQLQRVRLCHLV
jgi:hypothetical protein